MVLKAKRYEAVLQRYGGLNIFAGANFLKFVILWLALATKYVANAELLKKIMHTYGRRKSTHNGCIYSTNDRKNGSELVHNEMMTIK